MKRTLAMAGIVCLVARTACADDASRLAALEARVDSLARDNAALHRALAGDGRAGQVVVRPAGREPVMTLGGLLQSQAEWGDRGDTRWSTGNDRVLVRRARVTVGARYMEEFDVRLELDLAGSLAAASGLRAQMTDGYAQWTRFPACVVRAGQFKTPFGFEQLYPDARLPLIERTMVSDRLALGRQPGVQVSGDVAEKRVSYAVGAFNGTGANTSANDGDDFAGVGRVSVTPWRRESGARSWTLGANAASSHDAAVSLASDFGFDATPGTAAKDDVFAGSRQAFGGDTQLAAGHLEVWAEYLRTRFAVRDAVPRARVVSEGWYAQGCYTWAADRLQTVARYESFDPDTAASRDRTRTWTAGAAWLFKGHDVKVLANYVAVSSPVASGWQHKVLARLQTAL